MAGIQDESYLLYLFLQGKLSYQTLCLRDENIINPFLYLIVKQSVIGCQGAHFRCPVSLSFFHIAGIKPEFSAYIAKRLPESIRPGCDTLFAQILPEKIDYSCVKV